MEKIDVLDHGFVRLIDSMGSDLAISRAARVSYDSPPRAEDAKLIDYLWKNKHTTPFEAVTITFEVKAPIFVFRQWHRHRTWSYNELSARYRELPEEYYLPAPEMIGKQSTSNKQMRVETEVTDNHKVIVAIIDGQAKQAFKAYRELLSYECPREIARSVLPVTTYSHMFCTVDLLNLFRFLTLRTHEHAQYEIRVYAEAMLQLIEPIVPQAVAAFKKYNVGSMADDLRNQVLEEIHDKIKDWEGPNGDGDWEAADILRLQK